MPDLPQDDLSLKPEPHPLLQLSVKAVWRPVYSTPLHLAKLATEQLTDAEFVDLRAWLASQA